MTLQYRRNRVIRKIWAATELAWASLSAQHDSGVYRTRKMDQTEAMLERIETHAIAELLNMEADYGCQ